MTTAIVWFRRDLRMADNPALRFAVDHYDAIVPLYIHAPDEEAGWPPGGASRWWLHHSLEALASDLEHAGAALWIRHADSAGALDAVIRASGAEAVVWNRLYEPALRQRDARIKHDLKTRGIAARSFNAALLLEPWETLKDDGEPYKVFTPFWRSLRSRVGKCPDTQATVRSLAGPADATPMAPADLRLTPGIPWDAGFHDHWQPGETGAQTQLSRFVADGLHDYDQGRNRPDRSGSSRLSPHLHFGELSPRQIWRAVNDAAGGLPAEKSAADVFLSEIAWREFAHMVLYYWPDSPDQPMQQRFADYPWRRDEDDRLLKAWQRGTTGIPLVDAGMRELWHSGWMHNRVRMVVASFLTKHLRLPWQAGERWFWDTLVDADLASNAMGWQWTAGCGTDAAPYFRVFNPVRQAAQYDPDGAYIARWCPELAALPVKWRAAPWTAPAAELARAGITLGLTYPHPLVDLDTERRAALAAYAQIKD